MRWFHARLALQMTKVWLHIVNMPMYLKDLRHELAAACSGELPRRYARITVSALA